MAPRAGRAQAAQLAGASAGGRKGGPCTHGREVEAAAAHWDAKLDGERTFPTNDARKVRQRLARERAEQFIVEHSTLTPPPDEPIVQKVESK